MSASTTPVVDPELSSGSAMRHTRSLECVNSHGRHNLQIKQLCTVTTSSQSAEYVPEVAYLIQPHILKVSWEGEVESEL